MDHRRADAIIREIAQLVKGDFLINDDHDLTMAVARKLASQSRGYAGGMQSFGAQKMSCTAECTREEDKIIIGKDGVVFGPYSAFPAGKYIASFYMDNAQEQGVFTVESQDTGVVCSVKSGEIQPDEEGAYQVEFFLPKNVEQLELKVHNPTDSLLVFHKVTVTIPLGRTQTVSPGSQPDSAAAYPEPQMAQDDGCAAVLEELQIEQNVSVRMFKEMGAMVECRPPQGTKFAFFKKVIRKGINCYVLFQVEFNKRLLQQQKNLVGQSRKLLNVITALWSRQNHYEVQLTQMEQRLSAATQQMEQLREVCRSMLAAQTDELGQYNQRNGAISSQIQQLAEQVGITTNYIHELTETQKNVPAQIQTVQSEMQAIQSSMDGKVGELWAKIKRIDDEFEAIWKHNRETNLNLDSVWRTYNTMRQEVIYVIDHRTRTAPASPHEAAAMVSPKILPQAEEKIKEQGGKIRLNLGSGNLSVEGYLSVDARELSNVDIVADISKLPYEKESVDEIFSAHLIEHFTRQRMEKELLPYWRSLLKTGGTFRVIFPDLEAMIKAYETGEMDFSLLGTLIMGGQDYQLDYHYAVYSPELVVSMLENAGFHDIRVVARGRENGGCRESEIVAIR